MRLLRLRTGSPNCILRHKFAVLRSMCKDSIKKTQNNAMFQSENCHKRLHFELSALTDIQSNPIMNDEYSVNICNECIDNLDSSIPEGRRCYIGETYPLLSYYRSISIDSMEVIGENSEAYARKLCNTVLQKTRKMIFSKHYRNKYTGRMIFPYDRLECMDDILSIEKILFRYVERGTREDPDIDLADLFSDLPAA